MKYLCGFLLSTLLVLSVAAHGSTAKKEVINVWIMSILAHEIVTGVARPFLDSLGEETNENYRTVASVNIQELFESCIKYKPKIIVVSITIGEIIKEKCAYRYLVVSLQDVNLLVKNGAVIDSIKSKLRVGLIKNIKATVIAEKELPELYDDVERFIYSDIFELIRKTKKDKINAIVLPQPFLLSAPKFSKKWKSIYTFKDKGVAVVMVSPLVDKILSDKIGRFFLKNDPVTKSVWQDKFGLGSFVRPGEFAR